MQPSADASTVKLTFDHSSPSQRGGPSADSMHLLTRYLSGAASLAVTLKHVPLVVLLGLGAHVSKNALAPAEPVLEQLGMSPIEYSVISSMSVLGAIVTPVFWGLAFQRCERIVLILVPAGILFGQLIILGGLVLHGRDDSVELARWILLLGLVVLSLSRGGGEVVQHTVLARLLPEAESLVAAFVVLIFSTHFTVAMCNWIVPQVVQADGFGGWRGVVNAQLVFSAPSVLSVLAACLLAFTHSFAPAKSQSSESEAAAPLIGPETFDHSDMEPCKMPLEPKCCSRCEARESRSRGTQFLIISWGALMVGILHAFQSVTNSFLVWQGISATAAGSVCAANQSAALLFMPCISVLAKFAGLRGLMFFTSLLTLCASIVLSVAGSVASSSACLSIACHGALLVFALSGVTAPILPLTLIPSNTKMLAKSYGMLDSFKSLCQVACMLVIGIMRRGGDFQCALVFTSAGLGVATVASALLLSKLFPSQETNAG
eukprot:TRINITY_DN24453_c0_g1_i1.p1 TRINITY_DN24453_c0_g1~~TRINITY_DN24453_c0_g1_i1.p1  ORF type:complete len:517 (+),score=65.92 TRINITY_DN24453_c0_g1_i1:87-1553(+)